MLDDASVAEFKAELQKGKSRWTGKCITLSHDTGRFTIHFHIPAWYQFWRKFDVGVVNDDTGVGWQITSEHFKEIVTTAHDWMTVMAIIRRKDDGTSDDPSTN